MTSLISRLFSRGRPEPAAEPAKPLPPIVFTRDNGTAYPEPTLAHPVSQTCTLSQLDDPLFASWCARIGEAPRHHRKQWEFCYILQALEIHRMLSPGRKGLGFGVGTEPLVAVIAAAGADVLATDLEPDRAHSAGWTATAQHARDKAALNARGLCDPARFDAAVDFRFMDMTRIDRDLAGQFDFCWSACAFEHLGTIAAGLEFVERSIDCLRPGGIAVHTTELNCSSESETLESGDTVLFRRRDFLALQARLAQRGCVMELNFALGDQPLDQHVDVPPYSADPHLKLQIAHYASTSIGLLIRKDGAPPAG